MQIYEPKPLCLGIKPENPREPRTDKSYSVATNPRQSVPPKHVGTTTGSKTRRRAQRSKAKDPRRGTFEVGAPTTQNPTISRRRMIDRNPSTPSSSLQIRQTGFRSVPESLSSLSKRHVSQERRLLHSPPNQPTAS